jgi:hypothetical protein
MKKQYIKPEIIVFPMSSPTLMAGSMGPNGQQDPSMAPEYEDDNIFASPIDELFAF